MVSSLRRSRTGRLAWAAVVFALVVAACGGGGDEEGGGSGPPATGFLRANVLAESPYLGRRPVLALASPGVVVALPRNKTYDTVDRYYEFEVGRLEFTEYDLRDPMQLAAVSVNGDTMVLAGITCDGIDDGKDCRGDPDAQPESTLVEIDLAADSMRPVRLRGFDESFAIGALGVSGVGPAPLFLSGGAVLADRSWATVGPAALVNAGAGEMSSVVCGVGETMVSLKPLRSDEAVVGVTAFGWKVSNAGVERAGRRVDYPLYLDQEIARPQIRSTVCTDVGQPIVVSADQVAVISPVGDTITRVADAPPGAAPHTVVGASESELYSLSSDGIVAELLNGTWATIDVAATGGSVDDRPSRPKALTHRLVRVGSDVLLVTSDRTGRNRTFIRTISS